MAVSPGRGELPPLDHSKAALGSAAFDSPLGGLLALHNPARPQRLSDAAMKVAMSPAPFPPLTLQRLLGQHVFGDKFENAEAQPIHTSGFGWSAPWSDEEAKVAIETANEYQSSIHIRHCTRTSTRRTEWQNVLLP